MLVLAVCKHGQSSWLTSLCRHPSLRQHAEAGHGWSPSCIRPKSLHAKCPTVLAMCNQLTALAIGRILRWLANRSAGSGWLIIWMARMSVQKSDRMQKLAAAFVLCATGLEDCMLYLLLF